jgi:hypothetical protein
MAGIDAEADPQHPARAARGEGARRVHRYGRPAALLEQRVERAREIGRGVRERAVEIEQNRPDRQSGRIAWTM